MPNFVAGTEALRGIDPKCGTGYVQVQRGQGDFPHHELGNLGAKQLVRYRDQSRHRDQSKMH